MPFAQPPLNCIGRVIVRGRGSDIAIDHVEGGGGDPVSLGKTEVLLLQLFGYTSHILDGAIGNLRERAALCRP